MKRAVLLLMLVFALLLAACGRQANGGGSATTPSASPTVTVPAPTGTPSPTPVATPTPTPTPSAPWPPAGFTTASVTGGASTVYASVTAVRVGSHDGYDRFVVEFSGGVPSYSVSTQPGTRFTLSPKGEPIELAGSNGVLITVQHINWTGYRGPTGFEPGFAYLRQAVLIQNFEGTQQWALGIAGSPAVRVFALGSPSRLVVDVTAR